MFAAITASPFLTAIGASSLWLVEVSYLPQLWRLFRMKQADEFSFLFPSLNILGRLAGLAMSIVNHSPLFGWFFVTGIILRFALLSEVVYFRSKSKKRRDLAQREVAANSVLPAVSSDSGVTLA